MRVWPVRRPTHAPATAIRINATAPPTVIPEFSGAAPAVTENIRNLPRQRAGTPWENKYRRRFFHTLSCGQHMLPQRLPVQPQQRRKNLNPSCCRSTGGMRVWPVRRPTHAPATAIRINATAPPTVIPEFSGAAPAVTENIRNLPRQRAGTPWENKYRRRFFHTLSCGQHMLPQRLPVQPQKNPPHRHSRIFIPLTRNENSGISAARRAGFPIGVPIHCRGSGG